MNPRSLTQTAAETKAGRTTPLEAVERCLAAIERFEPRVKAWVYVDADGARQTAARLGDELARGHYRGPLHGMPLAIKDIVDVAGWPTRAGSPLRAEHRADADATIVTRLRDAGAVLLGKTVTTEFASFDPPPTRNPWNLDRTPGGSSSGSAAAVALGMCLGAIGSQTGGSITRPASYCGVCGCKPTLGRVSSAGLVPLSFHLDHPGPIARSVGDLAIMLDTISGYDPRDPASIDMPVAECAAAIQPLSPPRLGVLEDFFLVGASPAVQQATRSALADLARAGATLEVVRLPPEFDEVPVLHRVIMAVEAAQYHADLFARQRKQYGPHIARLIEEGLATVAIEYATALEHRRRLRREMLSVLGNLDALVTPATVGPAPGIETTGDPKFNSPWSYTGLPTISFPCGLAASDWEIGPTEAGLPVSLQLIGRPFDEPRLFSAAAWCEKAVGFKYGPAILNDP
jgi:Asp-tRNA(Asn)/Glu-tRNA(Gln) amidotransferase A subunit family amidase